ncbi:MAG: hypothetical protein V4577_19745 [Bacteroidota bacterium]
METLNIILKISALLAIIVVPLIGPKKKKEKLTEGLSAIAVNDRGYLEPHNTISRQYTDVH